MIRVGIAGIGFMGWIHWLAYRAVPGIEVAAIATRDARKRVGDWTSIQGNFGPPGTQVDLSNVRAYADWRELVADPALDLIDICLPPNQHPAAVDAASAAGKDVFCEKPLALTAAACDQMVAACRQRGRQLLVGHVLPFFREYQFALEVVRGSSQGTPLGGHFRRVISRPDWIPDFFDPTSIGGPLIDLHVHDAHFIRLVFGRPRGLLSQGWLQEGAVKFATTLFDFGPGRAVSATMGVIDQPGRPFTHGFELLLEDGTLQFEYAALAGGEECMPIKWLQADGSVVWPAAEATGPLAAFEAEIAEVVRSITEGQESRLLSGELARDAIALCEAQARSIQEGCYVSLAAG